VATTWKENWYEIIFRSETKNGKRFDIILILMILLSTLAICFESLASFREKYLLVFRLIEWAFTITFTIEYVTRLLVSPKPRSYALSFYGIIDLLAIFPTYLSLLISGVHSLMVIRIFRLLRIFKIMQLNRYIDAGQSLTRALWLSRFKIIVFVGTIVSIVTIVGAILYLVEGPKNGFTSVPMGVYWAVVTLTTVGFGDITPQTSLGKTIAVFVMICGYGIIAVPTGIVTAQMTAQNIEDRKSSSVCPNCRKRTVEKDALYCPFCGGIVQIKKDGSC